jgi:hypothetical protein
MHQYNLGVEEGGEDGELVVSKVFYQLSSKQTGTPEMDSVTEEASDALTIRSDPITPITNPPLPRCLMNSPCDTEQNGTISHDQVSHATDNEDRANKLIALLFFFDNTSCCCIAEFYTGGGMQHIHSPAHGRSWKPCRVFCWSVNSRGLQRRSAAALRVSGGPRPNS